MRKKLNNKLSVGGDQIPKCFVKNSLFFFMRLLQICLIASFRALRIYLPNNWFSWYVCPQVGRYHCARELSFHHDNMHFAIRYSVLLNKRLSFSTEARQILSEVQQGARPNRSTSDNVFLVQQVRKMQQEAIGKVYLFSSIFQTSGGVNREKLYDIMKLMQMSYHFRKRCKTPLQEMVG